MIELIGGILVMAKLQIPITDELMQALKMLALQQKTTLKDLVTKTLTDITTTSNTTITQPPVQEVTKGVHEALTDLVPESKVQEEEHESLDPADFMEYYVLRKTVTLGKATKEDETKFNGVVLWSLPQGAKQHYDELGGMIPFRYTLGSTEVWPDEDELQILEESYGKPVKIER
jgi:hypothetical protein